jgi:Zn-dependent peptidase ImmA (M78 family)
MLQILKGMVFLHIEKYVRKKADNLIKAQSTSDPDNLLASNKNITFRYLPMTDSINGMYQYISDKKQILAVNDYLEGLERHYACFHELEHVELEHKRRFLLNAP